MAAAAASQPRSPRLPVDMDAETFAGLTALLGFRRVASSASLDADDAPSPQRRSKKKARSDRSLRDAGLQSSRYRGVFPNGRKWTAQMHKAGYGKIYLGNYAREEECGEKLLMEGIDVADIVARLRPPANDRSMYSSKHKGVSWCEHGKKWRCAFREGGRVVVFGYFDDEDEAGLASVFAKHELSHEGSTVESVKDAIRTGKHRDALQEAFV